MNQQHDQFRIADCGLRIECAESALCSNPRSAIRNPKSLRPGLTLIEVVASTMIVGMMAVAALDALAAATKSSNSIGNRAVAAGMADELMAEIMMQSYRDPDGSPVFGHESGESTNVRSAFDDVDDYDGWVASPPQYRDGSIIPDRANWRQRVTVNYVSPTNLSQTGSTDLGVKRIRVQIEYQNQVLADEYAFRTDTDDK
jgi:prepilin-type N-terminal cleavage/methylation domain-containing protein